jgi:hypothetical protein
VATGSEQQAGGWLPAVDAPQLEVEAFIARARQAWLRSTPAGASMERGDGGEGVAEGQPAAEGGPRGFPALSGQAVNAVIGRQAAWVEHYRGLAGRIRTFLTEARLAAKKL